jgi:tRNA dimethylallyltransferase
LHTEARNLVIILGPTGVGKSQTAVRLALRFDGEVINGDSLQVYRGFEIGTDKPTPEARRGVRHHLLDIVDPSVQFTAADFVREALRAADDILDRRRLPFVVGGTGLYLKALVDGLFPGPGRNPSLRARLEAEAAGKGLDALFRELEQVDPAYARKVRGRDRIRIIRALEVYRSTGRPMSEHFRETTSPVKGYRVTRIGLELDRAALNRQIEDRVERMFGQGFVEEVRALLGQGIGRDAPPFRALGYRHVLKCLDGLMSLEDAKALTKLDTRHYAKRQMTWFRKMAGVTWYSPSDLSGLEHYLQNQLQ